MLGLGNLLSKGKVLGFPNKYSFNFDGSNDYLEIADTDGLDVGTNDFTFSAWVYLSDASENYILSKLEDAVTVVPPIPRNIVVLLNLIDHWSLWYPSIA